MLSPVNLRIPSISTSAKREVVWFLWKVKVALVVQELSPHKITKMINNCLIQFIFKTQNFLLL